MVEQHLCRLLNENSLEEDLSLGEIEGRGGGELDGVDVNQLGVTMTLESCDLRDQIQLVKLNRQLLFYGLPGLLAYRTDRVAIFQTVRSINTGN